GGCFPLVRNLQALTVNFCRAPHVRSFPTRLVVAQPTPANSLVALLPTGTLVDPQARAPVAGRWRLSRPGLARSTRQPSTCGAGPAWFDRFLLIALCARSAATPGRARLGQCGAELARLFGRAQSPATGLPLRRQ